MMLDCQSQICLKKKYIRIITSYYKICHKMEMICCMIIFKFFDRNIVPRNVRSCHIDNYMIT